MLLCELPAKFKYNAWKHYLLDSSSSASRSSKPGTSNLSDFIILQEAKKLPYKTNTDQFSIVLSD